MIPFSEALRQLLLLGPDLLKVYLASTSPGLGTFKPFGHDHAGLHPGKRMRKSARVCCYPEKRQNDHIMIKTGASESGFDLSLMVNLRCARLL